ncbi:MAG: hypothetical protein HDT40_02265 [Lachnospiraceae bacterium]|nr:hypothetical protein [Lachnospiraceae bacterium]
MKYCMWYAFAQLLKNKITAIITTAMAALGFILVGYAGVTYARFHNAELVAKKRQITVLLFNGKICWKNDSLML